MLQSFTCCVGTGMESHALHGYGVYYESADTVWVNLFVPSTAHLAMAGAQIAMDTGFPDGDTATIKLTMPSPKAFTLAVRRPVWAGDAFAVKVNGMSIEQPSLANLRDPSAGGRGGAPGNEASQRQSSSFVELTRTWKTGDTIELSIPKSVHLEPTPDNKSVAAIMWGPLVLAGDLGPRREGRAAANTDAAVPVLVAAERPVTEWVLPAGGRPGDFRAAQVARVPGETAAATDVALTPFHRTHRRNYSVYFDVLTSSEFDSRAAAVAAERARVRKLEAATIGSAQPGVMQSERDTNYESDPADRPVQRANGRASRGGQGWFSFDLPVDSNADVAVAVTYLNELGLPPAAGTFDILVDGTAIAHFAPNTTATGFFDVLYPVPSNLVRGKPKVTVRFQSTGQGRIAPVFGVRTIRAKEM
jgi:hypothetical protein